MKNFIQRHFVNKMSPFQLFVAVSLSSSRIMIPFCVWQISICLHGIGTIHLCNISTLISKTDLSYVSGQKLLCVFCHEGSTIAGLPQAMHPCSPIISLFRISPLLYLLPISCCRRLLKVDSLEKIQQSNLTP